MECRTGCAACCIAPEITTPIPGMPNGKPAGVRCINLDSSNLCTIWGKPDYPELCKAFKADIDHCGSHREQALEVLTLMEQATAPDK